MLEWTGTELNEAMENTENFCFYLYTPLCGTCQVASKMLGVTLELFPEFKAGKMNLNYGPEVAEQFEIESVPCLLLFSKGQLVKKIYAFQSVPFLFQELKEIAG
ncbi:thioredoxin family protein [Bacillus massiliglaciei]|uniref:thioredoxin family protein n=1 Tax=Bacillus massiliglaciei TaxID=1816693 RepID=UPI000B314BB2|nr:thioredoxin family protein [Bacillus massiliglaciei]